MNWFLTSYLLSIVLSYGMQRIIMKHYIDDLKRFDNTGEAFFLTILFVPYFNFIFSITYLLTGMSYSWKEDERNRKGMFRFIDLFYGVKDKEGK